MATQTRSRERSLNVVLRPGSPAEADYTSAVLAPGFEAGADLNLEYFGGKTIAELTYMNVYLGRWDSRERAALDGALAGAMADAHLNNVLAQYFAGQTVSARFAGSVPQPGPVPARVYKDTVERLVTSLAHRGTLAPLDLPFAVVCLLLPDGAVLVDGDSRDRTPGTDSEHGLGGYHGSVHVTHGVGVRETVYYAVAVHSSGSNGIVAFDEPWKNVCATLYHELQEARTDPDVEDAIRAGRSPDAARLLGWYSRRGGEIGDIPMAEAHGDIELVMREVPLADGSGTAPIQLMWSNAVGGPEGPIARPTPIRARTP